MGAKIGSFLATLMLSVPLAAVGLMAVFGVPQIVPAGADQGDGLNRGPGRKSLWESIAGDSFGKSQRDQGPAGWNEAPRFASGAPVVNPPPSAPNSHGDHDHAHERDAFSPAGHSVAAVQPHPLSLSANGNSSDQRRIPEQQPGPFGPTPREAALADARLGPPANVPDNVRSPQLDWQQAQQRLTQLGIENLRVSRGLQSGSFLVVCSYTPPESPRVTHRFEAEAAEPLQATNKVLGQIEHWMQSRFQAANLPPRSPSFSLGANGPGR